MPITIIAHRCGQCEYPEQTAMAAGTAFSLGADIVEIDIRYTADNYPVLCHDITTERVFGEAYNISELTMQQFLSLRCKDNRIYSSHALDDILSAGIEPLLLHCKVTGRFVADIISHLQAYHYEEKIIIGVSATDDIKMIKEYDPQITKLAFMPSMSMLDAFLQTDADIIRLWDSWATQAVVQQIQSSGKQVWIMVSSSKEKKKSAQKECLLRLANMGVDGVLVDDVLLAAEVLRSD